MRRPVAGIVALAVALSLLAQPIGGAGAVEEEPPKVSAAGYALYEVNSGRLILSHNGDKKAYMASTTKIMTALLAVEANKLEAPVPVPDDAVGTEGSSMYLSRGETLTLRDLLYGLMLVSGNDAAVTIAEYLGGSVEKFAQKMNVRAAELGCKGTHFANPNGLPDENHYTTANDLGRIAAEAMRNPDFRKIVSTTYHETTSGDRTRTLKNKNKILWQYEGGNGVKTGYTKAAGKCLVFSAERGGMTLVGAVLNAPDMWNDAAALLDYGFASVENKLVMEGGRSLCTVPVLGGDKKELAAYPKGDILYPIKIDGTDTVTWEVAAAESLAAPVLPDTVCGEIRLYVDGVLAQTVPMVVHQEAVAADLMYYLNQIWDGWAG